MVNTKVKLCGIELDNPIIPASGTFGFGYEFAELYDINILGSLSFKGTTLEPRFGNPCPRIAECDSGMLNAVGLQNPGVDKVIEVELPKLRQVFHKPSMANVSGFSLHEYVETVRRLDTQNDIGWFEINISCPNVHGGGMSFGTSPEMAETVTRAVRDVTKKPIIANKTGGFSGPAIKPGAVRMIYQVYDAVKIPIVGMGGVSTAEDVIELMLAGATAVEVGAANLVNPYAARDIILDLPRVMEKYRINSLEEIIGGAH